MMTKTILLISVPIGAGHTRAAEAVAAAILSEYENANPLICNVFDFFSPLVGKTILKSYLKILKICPRIYGRMYNAGNESKLILKAREYINNYLAGRMYKFILECKPSLIICTHATAAGLIACLKKQGKVKVPIIAVITDYVVHRLWVYPEFDKYFTATREMADYLAANGVKKENIEVTGIPILPAFCQPKDKSAICGNLGLSEDKPTVLIMGGGAGILPVAEIFESLELLNKQTNGLNIQIIIVAGKNEAAYGHLASYLKKFKFFTVKLYGYVDNIHELMAVSDILISKPGGMTSAEALSNSLPLLIYRPLPGQEEENAKYLTGQGAAVLIKSPEELTASLEQMLIKQPSLLSGLKQRATAIKQPCAAFTILNCLKKYMS